MKLYGWIPHLGPDLNYEIRDASEPLPSDTVARCNDIDPKEEMHVHINVPKDYCFGETPIVCSIQYGEVRSKATIVIPADGLMSLDMQTSQNFDDEDVRYILREIYFIFKHSLHFDTHHIPDNRSETSLDGPDELLSVSHGENRDEAISEIAAHLIRVAKNLNDELCYLVADDSIRDSELNDMEFIVHDQFKTAMGFVVYAKNFANLFLPSDHKYLTSIDVLRESLTDVYNAHCNNDVHRMNSSVLNAVEVMKEQSKQSSKIAFWMVVIAISTLAATVIGFII